MVNDVYCIMEAMVGHGSELQLAHPSLGQAPQCVVGDPDRLRGILLNLYTNAGDFLPTSPKALPELANSPVSFEQAWSRAPSAW